VLLDGGWLGREGGGGGEYKCDPEEVCEEEMGELQPDGCKEGDV
jgi:hypothetical protein